MNIDKKSAYLHILVLLIAGFISYSHILQNPFVVDDDEFIVKWDATRSLKNIPLFFKGLTPEGHQGVYRPIRSVLYAVAYKLFGVNPIGYHIFSITVHLSSALLVYLILLSVLRNYLVSFISALFFAIHPIHAESVTYMASSFDVAGIVFILLSFYLFIQYTAKRRKLLYFISVLSAVLGYFAYEVTLVFPLLLILYNLCFKAGCRKSIYIPYFAGMLLYITARLLMIGVGGKGGYVLNSFYYMMLMMPKAFFKYISLLIFPTGLTMNHELYPGIYSMLYVGYDRNILSSYSFHDSRVLVPLIIVLAVIIAGVKYFRKKPIVAFCIGWFFISLIAVSNIIPTGIIMAERYLYLASLGYCLLLGCFLEELYNRKKTRYYAYIIFCVVSLFYFKTTIIRNLEWRNPLFLWDTEVQRFPDNPMANNNLGYAYMKIGRDEEAAWYLERAKQLAPYDLQTRENLQVCYINSGNYDKAIDECKEILEIAPDNYPFYKAYVNMSAAYNGKGMADLAIRYSKKAILLKPDCREAYVNLITACRNKGDYAGALEYYNTALRRGIDVNPGLVE